MTLSYPVQYGRYLLQEKIASGGMAEIFKATLVGVEGFEKNVVIKRIHPVWSERRDFITMLVDEAKLLVHLNHPNIVQVFELGREGETYYIAMEYVEGVDLRHLLQRLKATQRMLPQEIAIALLLETLKGLNYAHRRALKGRGSLGIVHRDVSPQNILISFEGEVKVTDFGIAKAMTQTHETQTGVLKGKYAYMSPEQAEGSAVDARSDLFACGIVLYEMLFGRRLFAGRSDLETLDNVRRAVVPWPEEIAKGLFPGLVDVLRCSLQARSEARFPDAETFEEALAACVPPECRIGRRELSRFIGEAFAEEVRARRQQAQELGHRADGFERQTKVNAKGEETASLGERPTIPELDEGERLRPKTAVVTAPNPRAVFATRWKNLTILFGALLFCAVLAAIFLQREARRLSTAQLVPKSFQPAVTTLPESIPTLPQAVAPESARATLRLRSLPGAAIMARFPGGELQGSGSLDLPRLLPGTVVLATATLENYEPLSRSFTVTADPSPQLYVLNLQKKAPAWGSIRVNADPWGRVSMAGYFSGNETPATRSRIPEGKYLVVVRNPALQKTLTATAVLKGGKTTRCHADFAGSGKMACR